MAAAERVLHKLKEVRELAETTMASAQDAQETAANRRRSQAPAYKVGDKVWLNLENIRTDRPCKKLDQRHAKYTVLEVCGSHTYRLDVPPGIYDIFPTRLLRPAQDNPLPGQVVSEPQQPGVVTDGELEYGVEEILDQKKGRGGSDQYLVKWVGYQKPTWEPHDFVRDLIALDKWEQKKLDGHVPMGGRKSACRRKGGG